MNTYAIILAAGKGTRMRTELPKCAYPLLKKPMIEYIVENLEKSSVDEIITVVGHKREVFEKLLDGRVRYAYQEEQLGTGHAVLMAEDILRDKEGFTVILPGDMPLIESKIIDKIISYHKDRRNDLTVVTTTVDNPKGYGRIIRNEYGNVDSIIEENDATVEVKKIKEINTGIYCVNNNLLFSALRKIGNDNVKGEYYLTDIVKILKTTDIIGGFILRDSYKAMGVNDLYSLSIAEGKLRLDINKKHMLNGVAIINPETVTIGHNVTIYENVTIHPNTYITGNSIIRNGSVIGPNTEIHNSIVGEDVVCRHSLIYDSEIMENSTVGPFAHLRQGAVIGPSNRIGNFVEVKNSTTGYNTKASHLAYIGDTDCGSNVNFGCGSITVNYDGVNKHKTVIGDDVFIGCNTNLIAPITIKDDSFIAAGSTVTKDIPKGALAIARSKQLNKEDYAKKFKKSKDNKK